MKKVTFAVEDGIYLDLLAVLEHWFLVLPLPSEALWSWGLRSRASAPAEGLDQALVNRPRSGSALTCRCSKLPIMRT